MEYRLEDVMPNHVETYLTVTGDKRQLAKFVKAHIRYIGDEECKFNDEECKFDFDTIILCPKELYDAENVARSYSYVDEDEAIKKVRNSLLPEANKRNEIAKIVLEKMMTKKLIKRYGHDCAYDFHVEEWGTKWGAYDCYINENKKDCFMINYNTAWSPAVPIFKKLATMYPKLNFENVFVDEGWGFAGKFLCHGGNFEETYYETSADIAKFCNEYMGGDYIKCEEHDCWHSEQDECYQCSNEIKTE